MILSVVLSLILTGIGIIPLYWSIGGQFGFSKSLPTTENGERVFNPRKIDSALVGLVLLIFGVFYILRSGLFEFDLPVWILNYGTWIIPIIFLLRAMGEFKYIGFFKSVKNTDFGRLDTKFFSPLCLLIGLFGILIHLIS